MDLGLTGKVVLVTGANGGIGLAICQEFLREGAHVCAGYRGEASRLDPLVAWAREHDIDPKRVHPTPLDLADEKALRASIEQLIKDRGRLDVLVNNAGRAVEAPFAITTDDEWECVLESNLKSAARLSRVVAREMIHQRSGSIVNVSSVVGHATGRGVAAYAASKAGLSRMTEIMAIELARKGIRVNAVAPGAIRTPMISSLLTHGHEQLMERTPMKRIGEPAEAARAVLFLASDLAASFITGTILYVDGGVHL